MQPTSSSYQSVPLNSDDGNQQDTNELVPIEQKNDNEYDALIRKNGSNSIDDDNAKPTKKLRWNASHIFNIVVGAGVGSLLEFYSFGLVAYFQTELKAAFFPPSTTDYGAMLQEFTLYGIAFAVRPFGGMLFGYIGDKYGRVYSLRLSLWAMVIPTMLYGLLPNYSTIGITATVLIFILRIVQGLCVGGEMSTALVYIIEESPNHLKATLVGLLYSMSCGSYIALIVYSIWKQTTYLESSDTSEWTWRIAFITSIVIGIFGIYVRRLMPNSYEFDNISSSNAILSNPLSFLFNNFLIEFFILFLGYIAPPVLFYTAAVWLPAYLDSTLTNSIDDFSYDVQLIAGASGIIFCALSGFIMDKYFNSYYEFVKYTMILTFVNTFLCFTLISISHNIVFVSFIQIFLSLNSFGGMSIVIWCAVWIPDARIRNTLTGITYNLGMALFVSTLFDVQTYLADLDLNFGGMFAGLYVIVLCLFSFLAIVYAHHKHTWKNYHFYGSINPHNIDDNSSSDNDISDNDIDAQNAYAVI